MHDEAKWQVSMIKDTDKLIWTNLLAIPTLADAFPVSSFGRTRFLEESPIPWKIGMRHINLNLSARRVIWHTTFDLGCYHSNIGSCFSSIFFWINAFLGRVTHSLKYRHAAHQLAFPVSSFGLTCSPDSSTESRSRYLLFTPKEFWELKGCWEFWIMYILLFGLWGCCELPPLASLGLSRTTLKQEVSRLFFYKTWKGIFEYFYPSVASPNFALHKPNLLC